MPVKGKRYQFKESNVCNAPDKPGVYALYDGDKVIYYGTATESVRDRLQSHLRGDEGPCTQNATGYKRERHGHPPTKERVLLAAYKAKHGHLPRCNKVMP